MAEPLNTSELGSKSYWDAAYTTELSNHATNASDQGTIWFSDTGAEEKVLSLLEDLSDKGILYKSASSDADAENGTAVPPTRFLDLGTGNGHMIFELREEGWEGELVGVDYSEVSVELAGRIAGARGMGRGEGKVEFHRWDLLTETPGSWLGDGFDVVLDKGTFDAISLAEGRDEQGRRAHEGYRDRVLPLVKKGGLFVITSCNWTREEVLQWFGGGEGELILFREVKYPSFTFAGQKGQSVCTLAFRRET
ncbi:hypothetical protein KVT40_000543 [Elsinoe batatas]|uniref:Protein-lysine N-methyltransferase EFM4 n=1 Tax=Elsinoe batatas TaxID=2601811 RepID=A0A8K0LFV2_9PEZI|nr:hypothetical protein KVT40_000543 [Elsinoe batatas]